MTALSVRELDDLPPPESNTSTAQILVANGCSFVIYEANPFTQDDIVGWAVVQLVNCQAIHHGGPNDEALANHPHFAAGVTHYAIQEIVDSPWIEEHARLADRDGHVHTDARRCRHVLFAFKEDALDCLADDYILQGSFDTALAAFQFALNRALGCETAPT